MSYRTLGGQKQFMADARKFDIAYCQRRIDSLKRASQSDYAKKNWSEENFTSNQSEIERYERELAEYGVIS